MGIVTDSGKLYKLGKLILIVSIMTSQAQTLEEACAKWDILFVYALPSTELHLFFAYVLKFYQNSKHLTTLNCVI